MDFDFSDLCQQVISIETQTPTRGSVIPGPVKGTWTAAYSNIPASVQALSGSRIEEFQKLDINVDYEILTSSPYAATVTNGQRVNDGTNKYIVNWFEDQGGQGLVYAIYGKRVIE